jgi:hypothetical protein
MFMHWKISGMPNGTGALALFDALVDGTTMHSATPGRIDARGRMDVTVYSPAYIGDSPEVRKNLVESFQSRLRYKFNSPQITIRDVTRA